MSRLFSFRKRSIRNVEIHPDEIFLDSHNLPKFDTHQFEGRLERPVSKTTFRVLGGFLILVGLLFGGKLWVLQIQKGEAYELRSASNNLRHTAIFAERGVIYDRTGREIAWNELLPGTDFSLRRYATSSGLSHVLGYVKYPAKDKFGVYYDDSYVGKDGVEERYDAELTGKNGLKITETDALGVVQSESLLTPPSDGKSLKVSVDAKVSDKLYDTIAATAEERGFSGGAGVIMDVHNGEILSLVSFPEYDSNIMTDGSDAEVINGFLTDSNNPFLDRPVSGLYIPGSIMKPFIALGVLEEGIISPDKQIESVGAITIPNPYDPSKKTIFRDWKVHGWVDMRQALAQSSDEYFYTVGGGYAGQKGIGIANIEKYVKAFGFGSLTSIDLTGEAKGTVPSPAWKQETFDERWYLGDTYNSSIGQYGFQVTPIQAVRAIAAFANGGTLVSPTSIFQNKANDSMSKPLSFNPAFFDIVRDGLRKAVTEGTAQGLNVPGLSVAAKTGTAELGISKQFVNSWVIGFFPYENPKFAFAVLMERGPRANTVGATSVMRQLLDWMAIYTPEYLR